MIYNINNEGTIGATKTITFSDTYYEHALTLSSNATITLNTAQVTPTVYKRLIRIVMPATVYSVTMPANVVWNRGFPPCMNVPSQEYLIELFTYNGGVTWCGSWLCEMEVL